MKLSLIILALSSLVFACGPGEGTERTKSSGTTDLSEGAGGAAKQQGNTEEEEETPVDIPTEVTGAFLICTPIGEGDEFEGQFGCGLRNADKEKIKASEIRDGLTVSTIDGTGQETPVETVSRDTDDSPWHVTFTLPADVEAATVEIKGSFTYEGELYTFADENWDQDDADIAAELAAYRDGLAQAAEESKDKAGVLQ